MNPEKDIKDLVLKVLNEFPNYDINDLFILRNSELTEEFAQKIMSSEINEISSNDFKKIGDNNFFLFKLGNATLNIGRIFARKDFIYLAIDLFESSRKSTFSYNQIVKTQIKEALCKTVLSEFGFDVQSNADRSKEITKELKNQKLHLNEDLYTEILIIEIKTGLILAKFGFNKVDNLFSVLELCAKVNTTINIKKECQTKNLIYEGICRIDLADSGKNMRENIEQGLKILEYAKNLNDKKNHTHGKILFYEGMCRSIASRFGINPDENLKTSTFLFKDAEELFDKNSFNYSRLIMNEGINKKMLADIGVNPIENLNKSIQLFKKSRENGFRDTPVYIGASLMNEGASYELLAEIGINTEENLKNAIKLYKESQESLIPKSPSHIRSLIKEGIALKNLADYKDQTANDIKKPLLELIDSNISRDSYAMLISANNNNSIKKYICSAQLFEKTRRLMGNNESLDYAISSMNEAVCQTRLSEIFSRILDNIKQCIFEMKNNSGINQNNKLDLLVKVIRNFKLIENFNIENNELKIFFRELNNFEIPKVVEIVDLVIRFNIDKLDDYPKEILNRAGVLYDSIQRRSELGTSFYGRCLLNEGNLRIRMAEIGVDIDTNFKKAENLYIKAKDISQANNDKLLTIKIISNLGSIKYHEHNYEKAYEHYKEAVELIEDISNSMKLPENKEEYFETVVDIYKNLVFICLNLKKEDQAFHYAESAKGRTFLELLSREYDDNHSKTSINKKFEMLGLKPNKKLRSLKINDEIMDILIDKLESENPELFDVKMVNPIEISDLIEKLNGKTLIEYFTGECLAIFVFTNDLFVKRVPINEEDLSQKVLRFRYLIKSMEIALDNGKDPEDTTFYVEAENLLHEFYQILIKPIKDLITKDIVIVPHGYLHLIPFHALYNEGYLLEDHKISFSQNATALKYSKTRNILGGNVVIGNPNKGTENLDLPMAEEEAMAIGSYLGAKILIGPEADKNRVLKEIKNKMIIHFACHSFFNEIDASRSGLFMSDNFITPRNFIETKLNAQLAVLSACESGLVELSKADVVEGLVRSIQIAGCRFVIASLWKVEDESTKELFLDFYKHPNPEESGGLVSSIQKAELRMMKEKGFYYWAAFQIYGV